MKHPQRKLLSLPPPPPLPRDALREKIEKDRQFANQVWLCGTPQPPRASSAIAAAHLLILSLLTVVSDQDVTGLREIQDSVFQMPDTKISLEVYERRCTGGIASLPSEQVSRILAHAASLCDMHKANTAAATLRQAVGAFDGEKTFVPTRRVLHLMFDALTGETTSYV